jgi:hypothetical protein
VKFCEQNEQLVARKSCRRKIPPSHKLKEDPSRFERLFYKNHLNFYDFAITVEGGVL